MIDFSKMYVIDDGIYTSINRLSIIERLTDKASIMRYLNKSLSSISATTTLTTSNEFVFLADSSVLINTLVYTEESNVNGIDVVNDFKSAYEKFMMKKRQREQYFSLLRIKHTKSI